MKILLDTCAFLWWISDESKLSPKVIQIIENPETTVLLSTASIWEITIKAKIGKLKLPKNHEEYLRKKIEDNNFTPLSISLNHTLELFKLENHHNDPFDRILIAQAKHEDATLITPDNQIKKYDIDWMW
jgi:PIN domain nuclease of toxin-antitoxin system